MLAISEIKVAERRVLCGAAPRPGVDPGAGGCATPHCRPYNSIAVADAKRPFLKAKNSLVL
jgi:hypothetical protein